MKKETVDALIAQQKMMQESLSEAIREVSERVWGEAVAACMDKAKTACTSQGFERPSCPYTVEAVERAKREAEQWG